MCIGQSSGALGKGVLGCRNSTGHLGCALEQSLVNCRTLGNGVSHHRTVDLTRDGPSDSLCIG